MSKAIRIVIDSVIDDLVRVIIKANGEEKTMDFNIEDLEKIIKKEKITDGRSYLVNLESEKDITSFLSGKIGRKFNLEGKIHMKETTKSDVAKVRELQKKLGLR